MILSSYISKKLVNKGNIIRREIISYSLNRQYQCYYSSNNRPLYRSEENKGKLIALEGLIGVGKSTLCNKLKTHYPDQYEVYREESNEKFLQLFYSNPIKYGFALQWGMLKSRIYQLKLAQHDTKHGRWPYREMYFWDRSMIGDYIFALWNHLLGGISVEEMDVYESEFGGSIKNIKALPFLSDIDLFVLMNDEPENCKYRIETQRKNESEQGIPISYYEGLDDIHFHVFIKLLENKCTKVVVQNFGEYEDCHRAQQLYKDIFSNKIELPTVITHSSIPNIRDSHTYLYSSENDIKNAYKTIKSGSKSLYQYKNIYIPSNIMRISPEEKNISKERCEAYDITFYKNEYKRTVLWHLSKFQNIHFYNR